ncbi:MAG: tyrosine-type recombinase/integrase [Solirubrobacterales bacterium]|nr:tyrosine-type recombinase/integrase [Solirubrobacterales bacterium]MBV9534835.1 tyrosine-type recombinase/integrase [Solirubrobacterales bacterium]
MDTGGKRLSATNTAARPYIRQRASGPFWYGKWSRNGRPVVRALGRAWVEADRNGGWRNRRGRAPEGTLTETQAASRMLALVREHHAQQTRLEHDAEERRRQGVTFRELAHEWLGFLEREKGVKPSTLGDYGWMLAEPGQQHRRGQGRYPGLLMAAFGFRPARGITTRDVAEYLRGLDKAGARPRTVNKHRQVISAIYTYGMREDSYGLAINPALGTSKRREPPPAVLDFYEPEEVEALARAAERGAHRADSTINHDESQHIQQWAEDRQDAELYRIAAYTGLRLGELLALRWEDVNLQDRRLVVHRAVSGGSEGPTKSWQARFVPLSDGAARALARLVDRGDFTTPDDYVFCSTLGRRIDGSALRRRFKRTAAAATGSALPRAASRRRVAYRATSRSPLGARVPRTLEARHHRALPARQSSPGGRRATQPRIRPRAWRDSRRARLTCGVSALDSAGACISRAVKSRQDEVDFAFELT